MTNFITTIDMAAKCGHVVSITADELDYLNEGGVIEGYCDVCDDYTGLVTSYEDRGAWDLDNLRWLLEGEASETIEF